MFRYYKKTIKDLQKLSTLIEKAKNGGNLFLLSINSTSSFVYYLTIHSFDL